MRISDWSSDVCSSDLAPGDIVEVTRHSGGVTARLADGSTVRARLLVAADGRRSAQREAAGIRAVEIDYGQTAIVATVAHELPHERSEEHTSELQSLMRISYAVFCLKKKTKTPDSKLNDMASIQT